ncbi:MAG: CPBP family intramembrane metalloprotease [Bacilli bacterium]|nr:CPBP family intramembrane metalloprotease [Bacilli bacterium]
MNHKEYRLSTEAFPLKKQILFFSLGWLGFQIIATVIQITIGGVYAYMHNVSLQDALYNSGNVVSILVNSTAYIALLVTLLLIGNRDLLKIVKSFGQWQSYLAGVICFASIIAFNIIYGNIINILKTPVSDNANQQGLETMDAAFPVISMVIFGFVGPICEELTYRTGLFSLLKRKNRVVAYLVTIVVFALIHFNFSANMNTLINELLNLPYYMFAAFAFSFTYDRFGFAGSVTGHIINNVFSLAMIRYIH